MTTLIPAPATSFSDRLVANVGFPLTNHLMNRRHIARRYRELVDAERLAPEAIATLQLARLRATLAFAVRHVPWYRRQFQAMGFDPRDLRTLDDLRRLPPLTRQEVIDHHLEMVDERLGNALQAAEAAHREAAAPIPLALFRRHRLVRNHSSGSTGAPTVFYEDGSVTALNWALEMRMKHWFGAEPGAREARLVRLSTTYSGRSLGNRWRRMLWHQLILPGVNLRDPDYAYCVEQLNEFQPRVLWGFTGSLTGLAQYLQRTNQRLAFQPAVAVGWAAPVYAHEKALLEAIFGCPAANIYGSREVGHIALQCPEGAFHINHEHLIVETAPQDEVVAAPGAGEVLVTTLVPTPMPFIRYRMGDLARLAPSRCACGRTLPVLEEFVGRTGEIFTTRDGRMIPPNFWCRLFMAREIAGAVLRFQVMYTREGDLAIRIARGAAFGGETEAYLERVLRENFAPATRWRIEYVEHIAPEISGKYKMVYREEA